MDRDTAGRYLEAVLSYDRMHNIAYLKLKEQTGKVQTIEVNGELNVDLSPDGTIYGTELLNASQQLQNLAGGKPLGKPLIEDFEALIETLEIMGDPEMMAALRRGIKDVQEGKLIPLEEVKARVAP